ncbi:MAG TPA: VWA domain-containing protein [Bacteroidota bacterium]|nr:VWA domain-containing protein [Bacteroidota bacterium]
MKQFRLLLPFLAGLLWAGTLPAGPPFHAADVQLDGRLNYPYVSSSGGKVFLQIALTTGNVGGNDRRPMNIAIVLDRSGSMSDQGKMEYAKRAISQLIDQLNENDILSVVIYDDLIEVLRPAKRIGRDKQRIKRAVERISPRNSTNLGGGMIEGFRQAERHLSKEHVNRVILLSDGLANQGITDPLELNRIARRYRARSISLTTMGVGLDYNENLMVGLSESGGGNYYFIESPSQLASMMRRELNAVSSVLAQNASIELTLTEGVRLLDIIGCEHTLVSDRYVIPVGDIYANDLQEFTVELELPEGSGTRTVATGTLRFETDRRDLLIEPTFTAKVHYTKDIVEIERRRDFDTQAKVDIAVSTRTVEKALKAIDEGRAAEAVQEIQAAQDYLNASPAASSSGANGTMIREQLQKLESYEDAVKDSSGNSRKTKKQIQFDNYRTRKNKQ